MGSKTKSGGGRKLGRGKHHQASIYKGEGRWDKNRKRAMRRHLRKNPEDQQNLQAYEQRYGSYSR
jgi:GrpB-like predicted nucleotidyltransferase (UPF0157 family)